MFPRRGGINQGSSQNMSTIFPSCGIDDQIVFRNYRRVLSRSLSSENFFEFRSELFRTQTIDEKIERGITSEKKMRKEANHQYPQFQSGASVKVVLFFLGKRKSLMKAQQIAQTMANQEKSHDCK